MNRRLQRAWLLIEQGRYAMAEDELRRALVRRPNHGQSHAMLALCLVEQKQYAEASEEAGTAIHLDPEDSYAFYVQAFVLRVRNRPAESLEAIRAAIRLDTEVAYYHEFLASLMLRQGAPSAALEAANKGLECDPESVECGNARASALRQLGQPVAAEKAFTGTLARDPENALTHAWLGWTLLDNGKFEKAMDRFREALRLDPDLEMAREGVIAALKAERLYYRPLVRCCLWLSNRQGDVQWGFLMALWIFNNFMRFAPSRNSVNTFVVTAPLIVYAVFTFSTWMALPLLNLTLLIDPIGRWALSREEKLTAVCVGLCIFGTIGGLVAFFCGIWLGLFAALVIGFLIPSVSRIYDCEAGWPRNTLGAITVVLYLVGVGSLAIEVYAGDGPGDRARLGQTISIYGIFAYMIGVLAAQFAGNYLVEVRQRR